MNTRTTTTVSSLRRHVVSAIIGTLALASAVSSFADDSRDVRKVTVKFADLNVSSPQGAAVLYTRIRQAARAVCADEFVSYPFNPGVAACVHKAIADAVTKVNQPALYAVYNEHNRTPLPSTLLSQSH